MSSWFINRKVTNRISPLIPASSFYSSVERTSDASSNDESDDTRDRVRSVNTSGSSGNDRDRNNNEKRCSSGTVGKNENTKPEIPAIEELAISSRFELELLPNFENLILNSDCETLNKIADLSLTDQKPLAGVVTSVAKVIGLIVVKPAKPHDVLLYIGSPVYFRKTNYSPVLRDVRLGWVIDVFGPACEPYYCVKPSSNYIELVHEGSELFYSPDHPRTAFILVKLAENNRYTVTYSATCHLRDDQKISGQTSEEDSSRRKIYRRRRRNSGSYRRGAAAYGSIYKNNQDSFDTINREPKHSYFDY